MSTFFIIGVILALLSWFLMWCLNAFFGIEFGGWRLVLMAIPSIIGLKMCHEMGIKLLKKDRVDPL